MLTFMSVALLLYGAMHFYVLGRVWAVLPHSWLMGLALATAGLVLTLAPFLVWFLERQGWQRSTALIAWMNYVWMGYLFLFVCLGLVADLGHGLSRLLHIHWPLDALRSLQLIGLLALVLLGYGFVEARQIRIRDVHIVTPKLAEGRITIAQLSDLHLGLMQGDAFLARVLGMLRDMQPDIVVATGDIVDGQGNDLPALARQLKAFTPPLGAYAVTGNHEHFAGLETSLQFLREAGFTVLRGDAVRVGGIVLAGVDDPGAAPPGQQGGLQVGLQEAHALASARPADFVVLLKHQPVVAQGSSFDLQLSGHIHGGQIFPFVYLTRLVYKLSTGLTALGGGRQVYVSNGTGSWGPPIRLLAPPEITRITITSTHGPSAGAAPALAPAR